MATTVLTKQMTLNIMLKSGAGSCTRRGSVYRWRRVPLPLQDEGDKAKETHTSVTDAVSDITKQVSTSQIQHAHTNKEPAS